MPKAMTTTRTALPSFELPPPLSIIRMVWKHKIFIVVVWLVIGAAGMFYVRSLPNVYRAESLIVVDSQKIPERFVASTVQVSLQDHLATISQHILSATQLQKIIDELGLYKEERKTRAPEQIIDQMRKDVQITPDKGAFRVAYEGRNPTVVAGVVNRISGLFIGENLKTREQRAEGTSEFIESRLQEARKNLEVQEANLSRFKVQRMGELPQQESALIGALSRLHAELQGNQDAINRAEQNRVMLENTLRLAEASEAALTRAIAQVASSTATPAAAAVVSGGIVVQEPPRRSETLRSQLESARLRYYDEHPEMKRLKAELSLALEQEAHEQERTPKEKTPLTARAASPAPANAGKAAPPPQTFLELSRERERIATTRTQLALITKEIDARSADRQRILKSIADYQVRVEKLPMREQELAAVTRDYEISNQNYRSLLDKKITAEMAIEMERRQQAERFTLVDAARTPSRPIKPKRELLNGLAAVAGLAVGLVLAVAIELKRNAVLGEWELPSDVRVLGRVSVIGITAPPRARATRLAS